MKCPRCQSEAPSGARFCDQCGGKLEAACPACGNANLPGSRFCSGCGRALESLEGARPFDPSKPHSYTPRFLTDKILTNRSSMEGERKLITVLFADVENFTSMSEKLDPEEVHGIMDSCFKILMDEIHRYEGTINQFTGDGVMALFGAPVSHEDHAQRACHAALAIQDALSKYSQRLREERSLGLRMRIGLNSGLVVVGSIGDDLRMDYTAIGDTVNLAARVQQRATPGEVWMSEATRNIVHAFFRDESVGEIELKGKAQPQKVFRVVSARHGIRTRFDAGIAEGMTTFVGRKAEMETLSAAFGRAKGGEARVIDVVGEAGVGKSRLVYEFQSSIGSDATLLTGICVQYGRTINFLPVIDVVRAAFGITAEMDEDSAGRQITETATNELAPMIPFYRNLLSFKGEDTQFSSLNPEGRKFGTFEAVKNLLLALSSAKPLVLFIEDVHWIDKISEELFTYFSRCMQGHKILMITAYRPETFPPWTQEAHYQRLGLETLGSDASFRLVSNLLGGVPLEPSLEQKIVKGTEGNPFFMEEIVRSLLDRGDLVKTNDRYVFSRPIEHFAIPNTVQGVLASRMDHLSEDLKRTIQVASVIGKEFAFRLLKSIMELAEDLRARLTNLVGLQILYEKALYPELEYVFKHALTQEVAYESLLKQRRQEIHWRIARTIEELYASRPEPHYELLAHHYERSGDAEKAVEYLLLAGEKSNRSMAAQTALVFFTGSLNVAEKAHLSLDPDKDRRIHQGLASASVNVSDINAALEHYEKALEVCQQHGMVAHEMQILYEVGIARFFLSIEREESIKFYDRGIARAREVGDKAAESGILSFKGLYVGHRGHPYEGYKMIIEAEAMALQAGNPLIIAANRAQRAHTERWLGRPAKAIELLEGFASALTKTFNLYRLSANIFMRGLALAEAGRVEEAMAELTHGIDLCEKVGAMLYLGRFYNTLGYCYSEIHHPEEAWNWNLKSKGIAGKLLEQYRLRSPVAGEIFAQSSINMMENLFDQGKTEEAWSRITSFEQEWRGRDYGSRERCEARLDFLASLILLQREKVDEARVRIEKNIETSKREHTRKTEGRFLRLLGQAQMKRNEHDNALSSMGEATQILAEVGNPRQLWEAHASLATVYDKLRRESEAREQWAAAAGIIHKQANGLSDRSLRERFLNAGPIQEIVAKAGT